jgi:signal transduction histidine kinase
MHDLPPAVRRYLWASYVACLALISGQIVPFVAAGALWDHPVVPLRYVAVFLVLAYAAERIQLAVNGSLVMSLTTPVHIAVILLFPPPYPVLITLVAVLMSQTSQAVHTRRPLYKRVFNVCHPTLVVGLSSLLVSLVARPQAAVQPGHIAAALPILGLLPALYYTLDTVTLLVVLVLQQKQSPWRVWQHTYLPSLLPELAASAIGILAAVTWRYDPVLLGLFVLPVLALRAALRAMAQAEERAAALRQRSDQLEAVLAAGERLRLSKTQADLLQPVAEAARGVVGAAVVAAYVCTEAASPVLERVVVVPPDAPEEAPLTLPVPVSSREVPVGDPVAGALLVPLEVEGVGVVGALRLAGVPAAVGHADRHVLTILATQAASALENARLLQGEQEARADAEAAVRVRNDFLTAASHDLRTPLTAIYGRVQLIQMSLANGRTLDRTWLETHMAAIHGAIRRMVATVEEITDAAQLQMGHPLSLHIDLVDVGELVSTVTNTMLDASGPGRSALVVLDVPTPAVVAGDRARLERVVQNIIGNAIKYSPKGAPIHVAVRDDDESVVITVRDSGVGIPADELPHVFTHFYRASTSIGIPGTGVGLAGSKTIVEQHGGQITLDSAVGKGTTVDVHLPRPDAGRGLRVLGERVAPAPATHGVEPERRSGRARRGWSYSAASTD